MSKAQDRFFPKASGPVNNHPGPDFPPKEQTGERKGGGSRMNQAGIQAGDNPAAWSAEAADDWPVPYTVTPAAERPLETGDRGAAGRWEWQGRTAGTAEIRLTEEDVRQSGAQAWGGLDPSASYAEWLAEGQAEAGS